MNKFAAINAAFPPPAVPSHLNGYPVIDSEVHANGYATVMVERYGNHDRYAVATWWSDLGTTWSWGFYCSTHTEAREAFDAAAKRNASRSA